MNIGIFFIGTDRYFELYDSFKESFEKYFLINHKKHYFITTDNINYKPKENETVNYIEHTNWKLINLNRFKYFLNFDISNMDYVFFFNANSKCLDYVTEEDVIPNENDNFLSSSWMDCTVFHIQPTSWCDNKLSSSYVENYDKKFACRGSFQGGKTEQFIKCCEKCIEMINEDSKINFIPMFNDEAYFNKYAFENGVKKVDENIITYNERKKPKILLINKYDFFGFDYMKKIKENFIEIKVGN